MRAVEMDARRLNSLRSMRPHARRAPHSARAARMKVMGSSSVPSMRRRKALSTAFADSVERKQSGDASSCPAELAASARPSAPRSGSGQAKSKFNMSANC